MHVVSEILRLALNALRFLATLTRGKASLAAENLFLRKQLGLFLEREKRPRRFSNQASRFTMGVLARLFDWREALVVVKPETLVRWHRKGFRLFWRWKSRRKGRRRVPEEIQALIRQMAEDNVTWGERRIANELQLKTGLRLSPRTVRKYMPPRPSGRSSTTSAQRWSTFVKNHADALIAADFLTVVTARFRILYVFVIMELGSRRLLHTNVTRYPTADWTLQQFREAVPHEHPYRFLILDRDSIYSERLVKSVTGFGLGVLRTPRKTPQANGLCERIIGTLRRECLDFLIPFTEDHLRTIVFRWKDFYNRTRPHMSLGPGIPVPPDDLPVPLSEHRHRLPDNTRVTKTPVLGGLHHDYRLEKIA